MKRAYIFDRYESQGDSLLVEAALQRGLHTVTSGALVKSIGVDCVEIDRTRRAIERWGERYITRSFTEREIAYCSSKRYPAEHFAGRFAAKEAVYKLFGMRWSSPALNWRSIEVVACEDGRPKVVLHGEAGRMHESMGFTEILLSVSHANEYAIAVAAAV